MDTLLESILESLLESESFARLISRFCETSTVAPVNSDRQSRNIGESDELEPLAVRCQAPLRLSDTRLESDISMLKARLVLELDARDVLRCFNVS